VRSSGITGTVGKLGCTDRIFHKTVARSESRTRNRRRDLFAPAPRGTSTSGLAVGRMVGRRSRRTNRGRHATMISQSSDVPGTAAGLRVRMHSVCSDRQRTGRRHVRAPVFRNGADSTNNARAHRLRPFRALPRRATPAGSRSLGSKATTAPAARPSDREPGPTKSRDVPTEARRCEGVARRRASRAGDQ
jgi:hypothetical protein